MNRLKKDFILTINNLKIDIITNSDNLNSYELGNIKRHASDLYETLVCEGRGGVMIIKDYRYENSTDGIHYIVDVDGYEFEVNHTKTDYGSVQHDDIDYYLDEISEFDVQEAELIEDFVRLQNYLLMYGVGFTFKNYKEDTE